MSNNMMNISIIALIMTMRVGVIVSQQTIFAEKDNDNDKLSKYDVDVLCDASEDYEENKEQCDKLYDMVKDDNEEDDED